MKGPRSWIYFLALALLCPVDASTSLSYHPSSPISSQAHIHTAVCHTSIGLTSVASVPTTTITRRIHDPSPVVVFSRTQETVTITPSESTLTVTDYETTTVTSTASTVTDVFSTTSTEFDTVTSTVTPADITSTAYSTVSISATITATIAASATFTPIADTLTTTTALVARSFEPSLENDCSPTVDDYQYPQEVICHEKIIIRTTTTSTVTESPATATAAVPSTTVVETSTITTSSVVVPEDVSTTLSYSATSTITEISTAPAVTDTVTSIVTVTTAVTTTSAYAACATNNIAGSPLSSDFGGLAGEYVYSLSWGTVSGYGSSVHSVDTAEDCCISCQEQSNCMGTFGRNIGAYYYCYLITTDTCSSSSTYGLIYLSNAATSYDFEASNGNCGQWRKSS
ncbi:hypothetical protein N7466_002844 [Penicillium verhagenii]|uniref:uncharacterized protein n=1 Tax=Penicillium verhagenii TaxID=1562060 RepID=UPI0025457B6E|nr:uncharacterized protein N7466_002844 [Penicillium verhagenii]KAJ5939710.1 hypothetical protein N7466_002844 [Penicillium verhagenii]